MAKKKRLKGGGIHAPHEKVRESCRICPLPRGRVHNRDTHRFHGHNSFCRTHSTTEIGKKYCTRDGKSKHRH